MKLPASMFMLQHLDVSGLRLWEEETCIVRKPIINHRNVCGCRKQLENAGEIRERERGTCCPTERDLKSMMCCVIMEAYFYLITEKTPKISLHVSQLPHVRTARTPLSTRKQPLIYKY